MVALLQWSANTDALRQPPPIVLRTRYAMSGNDVAYAATRREEQAHEWARYKYSVLSAYPCGMRCQLLTYAMLLQAQTTEKHAAQMGTNPAAICLRARYAKPGTDLARCGTGTGDPEQDSTSRDFKAHHAGISQCLQIHDGMLGTDIVDCAAVGWRAGVTCHSRVAFLRVRSAMCGTDVKWSPEHLAVCAICGTDVE
eukprot:3358421-Rhodomonas_salina.4